MPAGSAHCLAWPALREATRNSPYFLSYFQREKLPLRALSEWLKVTCSLVKVWDLRVKVQCLGTEGRRRGGARLPRPGPGRSEQMAQHPNICTNHENCKRGIGRRGKRQEMPRRRRKQQVERSGKRRRIWKWSRRRRKGGRSKKRQVEERETRATRRQRMEVRGK